MTVPVRIFQLKIINNLYRIILTSLFAFVLASLFSLNSMVAILKFKDLSLQVWKVKNDWDSLSLITSDIMFLQIDSIEALPELYTSWTEKSEALQHSFDALRKHPKIGTLSSDQIGELIHAAHIWKFSRERVLEAQKILHRQIRDNEILNTLLRGGEPTLYENIQALSSDPGLSFEEKKVYRFFSSNMAVFNMTRNEFTDILNKVNDEIPGILERQIFLRILMTVFLYLLIIIFTLFFLGRISKPMNELTTVMGGIGDMEYRNIDPSEVWQGECRNEIDIIQKGVFEMSRRMAGLYEENLAIEKEKQEARLKALQYQINPHFLYNTLGTIQMAALMENHSRLAQVIRSLSDLLRKTINITGEMVSLSNELSMIDDYINIMQFRYFDRINVIKQIPQDCMKIYIPSRILQPLLENAIGHGLSDLLNQPEGQGEIRIEASLAEDVLELLIRDNGSGMDPSTLKSVFFRGGEDDASHVGLRNIDERIKLHFGASFGVTVESRQGEGTAVKICLPVIESLNNG